MVLEGTTDLKRSDKKGVRELLNIQQEEELFSGPCVFIPVFSCSSRCSDVGATEKYNFSFSSLNRKKRCMGSRKCNSVRISVMYDRLELCK